MIADIPIHRRYTDDIPIYRRNTGSDDDVSDTKMCIEKPGSQSPRADEIGLREVTLALLPWAVESEKGLRAYQVGTD